MKVFTGYYDSGGREIQSGDILNWCGYKYQVMEMYWTSHTLEEYNWWGVKSVQEGNNQESNLYCFLKMAGRYGVHVDEGDSDGKL